jgi:hypothetical protein
MWFFCFSQKVLVVLAALFILVLVFVSNNVIHHLFPRQDLRLVASVLEDDMGEAALAAVTKVMAEAKTILPLVREEVQLEFMNGATEKDAILRGNCVASRVMSSYVALVGAPWVRKSLKVAA